MSTIVKSSFESFNYFDALFRNTKVNAVLLKIQELKLKSLMMLL